jgi:uncharacterized protein YpmB
MLNIKLIAICIAAALAGISSIYVFHLKPHNIIEVEAEKVIKEETGLTIDLDIEEDLTCLGYQGALDGKNP